MQSLGKTSVNIATTNDAIDAVYVNEIDFTDLYISAESGEVFLRGVLDDAATPLTRIAHGTIADIDDLRRKLLENSARPGADSLFFEFKKVRYSVTEISEHGKAKV